MSALPLPYCHIWELDFEFIQLDGHPVPVPVCMAARDLVTGWAIELWQDEFTAQPPFTTDASSVFVSFAIDAEMACFRALGWSLPERVIDLYIEALAAANSLAPRQKTGLLEVCSKYGIYVPTSKAYKDEMRALVMRGGPWTETEKRAILKYCWADVDPLGPLLEKLLPHVNPSRIGLQRALFRGRYAIVVGRMEETGLPVDVETLERLKRNWPTILRLMHERVNAEYDVFDGRTLKFAKLKKYISAHEIDWPTTATGLPKTDSDTLRELVGAYPYLDNLQQLMSTRSKMSELKLVVGPDGRNRAFLGPFGARSGRNAPKASEFVLGPSAWVRGLVKPGPGRAVMNLDWSAQEIWILAALSGDEVFLDALRSGDPYMYLAIKAGLAPPGATKYTHPAARKVAKTCLLGLSFGMGWRTLAQRTGLDEFGAKRLLANLARSFAIFDGWIERQIDNAMLRGVQVSPLGWPQRNKGRDDRARTLRNFFAQATGADMLRLAACLVSDAGVALCAPLHDALWIEADIGRIDEAVATTVEAMNTASRTLLGDGIEIPVEVSITRYPDRFRDPEKAEMWDATMRDLEEVEAENTLRAGVLV